MKKNVGSADRIIRTVAALVIAFFLLNGTITGTLGIVIGVVAILLIGTSAISLCPVYALLGISSRGKADESKVSV
jgi:hypothetical protein